MYNKFMDKYAHGDYVAYIIHINIFAQKKKGVFDFMSTRAYLSANDISLMLGVSNGFAYKLIREMNQELRQMGYLVISGKVPTRFFEEKWYGLKEGVDSKGRVAK